MTIIRNQQITSPLSDFNELLTVQRTPLIELKSALDNVSVLRNVTTITGSATATVESSEYKLLTTAATSD